jgi:hypothetical protein
MRTEELLLKSSNLPLYGFAGTASERWESCLVISNKWGCLVSLG